MTDLIVTWPKARILSSYLEELMKAERNHQHINFRIHNPPKGVNWGNDDRCFMVHSGWIRGFNYIVDVLRRGPEEVIDPITGEFWPEGTYIVRDPEWHPIKPLLKSGFQGWRYFERQEQVVER